MKAVRAINVIVILIVGFLLAEPHAAFAQSLDEATALNQQATQLYNQGRYSEAIPLAERALAIREKTRGPDHPDVAASLNNLGALYRTRPLCRSRTAV